MKITLAQINPTVGDLAGNLAKHLAVAKEAANNQTDLLVFPELSLTGYPPEDLLLRPAFIQEVGEKLAEFASKMPNTACMIGHPYQENNKLYNACSVYQHGKLLARYYKQHLPNYGVFDECRYFTPGNTACVFTLNHIKIGLIICEDIWVDDTLQQAVKQGAQLVVIPNASPYETDKHQRRIELLSHRAKTHKIPLFYCNLIGGQDELVFDGDSMVFNQEGMLVQHAGVFTESQLSVDITQLTTPQNTVTYPAKIKTIYDALMLGLRDYVKKNGFSGVLIGLSGGIDSALTLAIAVDALGRDQVKAIFMPSRYTATISDEDTQILAKNLNVTLETYSIEPAYHTFLSMLPAITGITTENIQARCRAILLMALSNQSGFLVLTTGNRSELAVGYCTLYGDMAGAFAVLKDVFKTEVYALARYRNQLNSVIPERIITRAPSAELSYDQRDEDSLAPYPVLDDILARYLNQHQSKRGIIAAGHAPALVEKIIQLVRNSEYKRRQSAIGPHINHHSFGKDWRYPITNRY